MKVDFEKGLSRIQKRKQRYMKFIVGAFLVLMTVWLIVSVYIERNNQKEEEVYKHVESVKLVKNDSIPRDKFKLFVDLDQRYASVSLVTPEEIVIKGTPVIPNPEISGKLSNRYSFLVDYTIIESKEVLVVVTPLFSEDITGQLY